MFIKVTQSGNRRYAQLVESFRNEQGKPRQRTVCTLGRLEAGGEVDTLIASLQRARGLAPLSSTLPARKWLIPLETDIKPQTTKRAWRGLMGSVVSNPGPQKVTSARV